MRTSWWWSVAVLVALAVGSYAFYVYLQPPKLPSGIIYGNGRVEATEVRIGSEVAGRVVESRIIESRKYRKGELLIRIDDRDFKIRLMEAQDDRLALMQNRDKMTALAHVGRHHTATARSNVRRYRALAASNDVSKQQLESVENSLSEAQGLLAGGKASVAQVDAEIAAADQAIALIRYQIANAGLWRPATGRS